MSSSAKKDVKKDAKKDPKKDEAVTHRRQKSASTDASAGKKTSTLRTNSQPRVPATTRDNRTGLPSPKSVSAAPRPSASRAVPAAPAAPSAAKAEPEGPAVKTRVTPISQSKYASTVASDQPNGATPQPASANPSTFGSMGPSGFGAAAAPQGYSMGPSGYGSIGAAGMDSQMGMPQQSSFQGNPYGSMANGGYGSMGPGGYGSMGAMGSQMGMPQQGSFQGNPYGSMGAGGMGSQMGDGMMNPYGSMGAGGMGSQMGDGMMNPYGSMGGAPGSMYGMGGMPGSMYGMDPNGAVGMNSMYGMNPMMMNSMYGMNPMMGSMYGMGGPMGSMYGMGGPMGSMYGMGSQYMLGRYNSMGLGSNYGSFYNVFRTNSARAEFEPSGGYSGAMGLFTAPENFKTKRKVDPMPEPSSKLSAEIRDPNAKREAPAKKVDAADASKSRSAGDRASENKPDSKRDSQSESSKREDSKPAKPTTASRDAPTAARAEDKPEKAEPVRNQSRGGIEMTQPSTKTEAGVHRITKNVDNGVHTIAVVNDKSFVDPSDSKKVKTPDGKSFSVDEVTATSAFSVDSSDLLVDIAEQSNCGHNVALLALCGKSSISAAEAVVKAAVRRTVQINKANESAGEKITIWANAAAFPQAGQCRDLLMSPTELVPKEATFGSHPIFGPRVTNIVDKVVASAEDAEEIISKAVNVTTDEELVYVLFTIKQIRQSPTGAANKTGDQPDVYISSLLVAFFREANMSYLPAIRHRSHTTFPGVLFSQAVGGACRTVVVVPVLKAEEATSRVDALQQGETMREIKNGSLRSGNVSRFLEFTQKALEKSESSQAKPAAIAQQKQMVSDATELIRGGPEVKPKVYEVNLTGNSAATATTTRNLTNDKTVRVALVVENADLSSVSDKDKATVVVAEKKEAEVDELVYHKKGTDYPKSDLMARTTAALGEGFNTAVLSVEGVSSVALKDRFTWVSFKNSVSDTLAASSRNGDSCEVHLHMCVVQQRQVLADLLEAPDAASATPIPLVVVSSPIVGPLVHNTKSVVLKNVASVTSTVNAALDRSAPFVSAEDTVVLAVAVSKMIRKKDKDVCLAALFTASAESPAPFVGLVTEDNRYSRSLFSYAIAGPCTTTMVLVVDKSKLTDPTTVTRLDDVKKVASKPNLPNRDGGVRRFTTQANQSLERAKTKIDEAKSSSERQHYERNAKKLPIMIEDHKALLDNPADASIPLYLPDGSRPTEAGTRSVPSAAAAAAASTGPTGMTDAHAVLVVLEQSGQPADAVKVDMENHTITCKDVSSTPTELIEMKGATLRSSHVDSIVSLALSGYNTAMLTADTAGSTVGRSLATRSVRMLLGKLTGKSEAYWSVVVIRNGKLKDMLAPSSSYVDMHIASSPIFGPCLDGASFVRLDESGSGVEEALKTAATERAYAGGLVLATVVPKIVQDDGRDVLMPSMVLTLAGEETKAYDAPLAVDQKQRGIFHYVFGGPCYTLFVAGIKPTEGPTTSAILNTSNAIMRVKNPPLRSGSVLRFIEHSEPKLKAMQGKLATAEGSEKSALTMQVALMEKMVGDAKSLIANPVNCVPPTYGNPKHRA